MLQIDRLIAEPITPSPFAHIQGGGICKEEDRAELCRDFPDPRRAGFFDVEDLSFGPSFAQLLADLRSERLAEIMEARLGCALRGRPRLIVARRWSAAKDGRPHTDGRDKVATLLVYLNDHWASEAGRLKMLESPNLDGQGGSPISPTYGNFVAFARSDSSWHGHAPFKGERRVVQTTWLVDDEAVRRKERRHARGRLWKGLWFSRTPAGAN